MKKIRVLIVDDSPIMHSLIAGTFRSSPDIEVIGAVKDPYEAREAIKVSSPDVITLDVEMPRMDGLSFLEKLMRLRPMPVVMVSALTQKGAAAAIKALMAGAVDCVGKPNGTAAAEEAFNRLPDIVRHAARANLSQRPSVERSERPSITNAHSDDHVILLGASTGGVDALCAVLAEFPRDCPPTFIVQHMPKGFTSTFAARLDQLCAAHVTEASDRQPLSKGHVYLAPGGCRHLVLEGRDRMCCRLREGPAVNGHTPSVDQLFHSALDHAHHVSAAVLTGMGNDGAAGLSALRKAGAMTLCQDEQSSVVYGMPRAAFASGGAIHQLPLNKVGHALLTARVGAKAPT
ncbi:MAG: chemotaxis response regulator protein-glutamate methylesterase [Pseudomonadota bacterium]